MKRFISVFAVIAAILLNLGPAYVGPNSAITLLPGQCVVVYSAERPLTGAFSQQVAVSSRPEQGTTSLSWELIWPTNPGAFNIQVQDADTDATGDYVTIPSAGTITSAPQAAGSGNFVARVELNPWKASFGRLFISTQTANAVNLTAQVCR